MSELSETDELIYELDELTKAKDIATVNDYRYFITCGAKEFIDDEKRYFLMRLHKSFVSSLSLREQFAIASELLTEIDTHYNVEVRRSSSVEKWEVITDLFDSFEYCESIEEGEYVRLLEIAPERISVQLIRNNSLPLNLLTSPSFLKNREADPAYAKLQFELARAKNKRLPEIIAYARKLVFDSEYMTDEMVVSVAGIIIPPAPWRTT